jgi:type I restriction enzyme S subunit
MEKGLKQTELGMIPEDWRVLSISNMIRKGRNAIKIGPFGSQLKKDLLVNSGCKVYGQENVFERNMELGDRYINKDHFSRLKSCELVSGDFVVSMMGTVGKCMIVPDSFEQGIMDSHLIRLRLDDKIIDKELLLQLFNSRMVLEQIAKLSVGGIMEGLSSSIIKKIEIPLSREIEEQSAIAQALSETDELIETLDRLIEKKRKIKQGAMQELLTGKKRLPGFSGEWTVKNLGEIAYIKTGKKNNKDKVKDGEYPFFVRSQNVERINSYSFDGEAILVPGEGGIGNIFHYIEGKFDYHQRVYKISDFDEDISGKFIYFYMIQNFKKQAAKNSVKATVDSLRLPAFQNFELNIPKSKAEQSAIAQILSDMDAEIEELEHEKEKYKQLKIGMMQQLLTGRIRLEWKN